MTRENWPLWRITYGPSSLAVETDLQQNLYLVAEMDFGRDLHETGFSLVSRPNPTLAGVTARFKTLLNQSIYEELVGVFDEIQAYRSNSGTQLFRFDLYGGEVIGSVLVNSVGSPVLINIHFKKTIRFQILLEWEQLLGLEEKIRGHWKPRRD